VDAENVKSSVWFCLVCVRKASSPWNSAPELIVKLSVGWKLESYLATVYTVH